MGALPVGGDAIPASLKISVVDLIDQIERVMLAPTQVEIVMSAPSTPSASPCEANLSLDTLDFAHEGLSNYPFNAVAQYCVETIRSKKPQWQIIAERHGWGPKGA